MDEIVGKIKKSDYLELALKMEELQHEQSKLKIKELQAGLMEKDSEVLKLRIALQKSVVNDGRQMLQDVKKSYEDMRDALGKKLGYELKDLVIDPITLEVKKIK
jgi:hypothetical protein